MTQALTRWTGSNLFRDSVDRFFNEMVAQSLRDGSNAPSDELATRPWIPAVDIRETADNVLLTIDLPGLAPEEVEITLQDQILTIAGQRKLEKSVEGETLRRLERSYGAFSRSFSVPAHLAADKIDARFDKGILSLTLPKADTAKARRIEIK
jgi:HSP20 family protein